MVKGSERRAPTLKRQHCALDVDQSSKFIDTVLTVKFDSETKEIK